MSNTVKWSLIVVAAIIVILLILPFLIPVNSFRPTIEQKASQALGRRVQVGNLSLSIFGGSVGVENLSIADDPKFSTGPFLTAKDVKVGVELLPLIFSKQLNVTDVKIVEPQVTLLRDPSGRWNFSSIGNSSGNAPAEKPAQPSSSTQAVSVKKLSLENGQVTVGNTNSKKRSVYTNVNLTASDVAPTNSFPMTLTMNLPGGGTLKLDGKAGPEDTKDAALTPADVKLTVNGLNLTSTGFLDPSLGLAGLVDVNAGVVSKDGKAAVKGQATLTKAILVQGGSPSGVPAVINFDTVYDLTSNSGVLNPSSLVIGNAKSNLSGTYKSEGDEFSVDAKVTGEGMPATDLEAFLPAIGVNLPSGSKLTAGTMNDTLHITGPTNRLVTQGNIGLFNGKLSGFDMGQKLSAVGSLAGMKSSGKDLDIQKFTTDVQMAPTGLKAQNLDLVVPSLGTVVGAGTVDSKNNLDFKLVVGLNGGMLGAAGGAEGAAMSNVSKMLGGGGTNCKNGGVKVPVQVKGTTSNPQFVPDVGGAAAGMLKSQLGCAGGAAAPAATNPAGVVNQLGGLLGKKKP